MLIFVPIWQNLRGTICSSVHLLHLLCSLSPISYLPLFRPFSTAFSFAPIQLSVWSAICIPSGRKCSYGVFRAQRLRLVAESTYAEQGLKTETDVFFLDSIRDNLYQILFREHVYNTKQVYIATITAAVVALTALAYCRFPLWSLLGWIFTVRIVGRGLSNRKFPVSPRSDISFTFRCIIIIIIIINQRFIVRLLLGKIRT